MPEAIDDFSNLRGLGALRVCALIQALMSLHGEGAPPAGLLLEGREPL